MRAHLTELSVRALKPAEKQYKCWDKDFMSAEYALSQKLSPSEVNSAIRSSDYEDYLIVR